MVEVSKDEAELERLRQKNSKLSKQIADLKRLLNNVLAKVRRRDALITAIRDELKTYKEEYLRKTVELTLARQRVIELQGKIEFDNELVPRIQDENDRLREQLASDKAIIEEQAGEIAALKKQNLKLQNLRGKTIERLRYLADEWQFGLE